MSHTDKLFAKKAKGLVVMDAAHGGLGCCSYDTAVEGHFWCIFSPPPTPTMSEPAGYVQNAEEPKDGAKR